MNPQLERHAIIVTTALFAAMFAFMLPATAATNPTAEILIRTPAAVGQTLAQTPTSYLENLYKWMLGFVGLGALFTFVYGGVLYITSGAVESTAEARKWMWNGLLGLIVAASSYLLLYTINPNLIGGFSIESIIQRHPVPSAVPPPESEAAPDRSGISSQTVLDDARGRRIAQDLGISYRDNVSFQNVRLTTMDEFRQLQTDYQNSSYNQALLRDLIYITSVTEGSHAAGPTSHASGNKFDLRPNPTLDSFIRATYTRIGQRTDGSILYRSPRGTIYADEPQNGGQPRHWDVTVPTR